MNTTLRTIGLLALLAAAGAALADVPKTTFLKPDKHVAAVGDTVQLHFVDGAARTARPVPWPGERIEWMFVRGGPEATNKEKVQPARKGDNFVPVTIKHPGVTLVGIDERPEVREMTNAELRAFVKRNVATRGHTPDVPNNDEQVRVRHVRSSKTLIRVPDEEGRDLPSAIATSKSGQRSEFRAIFDPTLVAVGSDLPVWFYVDGSKRPDVKVQATHVQTGKTLTFDTDPKGSGHFRVSALGTWRVQAHHLQKAENDPDADWTLHTATLSFEVTQEEVGK